MIAQHPDEDTQALSIFFEAFRHHASGTDSELARFFEQFEEEYHLARVQRAATTPHLDVLRVFGLENAELRHSDVLGWFLKADSEHEQGALFINALLQDLDVDSIPDERYTVLRERHGRTDVAVYSSGRFAVFIENKVRHIETKDQVSNMVRSMTQVCRVHEIPRDYRFALFLTDRGDPAITGPTADSQEFLHKNLRPLARVDLFESFHLALERQHGHSPLLMCFLVSYLHAIRGLRGALPKR